MRGRIYPKKIIAKKIASISEVFHSLELLDVSPTLCLCLIFTSKTSKTSQHSFDVTSGHVVLFFFFFFLNTVYSLIPASNHFRFTAGGVGGGVRGEPLVVPQRYIIRKCLGLSHVVL